MIYLAIDDGSRKKEGKKREISENRKESKKDKTCQNLYPFVLLHILVVLKERRRKKSRTCINYALYAQDQETEPNVLIALDLPLTPFAIKKKEL